MGRRLSLTGIATSCIFLCLSTRYAVLHGNLISQKAWRPEQAHQTPYDNVQAHYASPRRPETSVRAPQRSSVSSMWTTTTTDMPRYVFPAADSKYSLMTEVVACVLEGRVVNPVHAGAAGTAQSIFKHVEAGHSK